LRGDGQPQPGAAIAARGRSVGLGERLEDLPLLLGGIPMPVSLTPKATLIASPAPPSTRTRTMISP